MAKRIFDFSVALVALVILLPVFLIITIFIKFDSKGPVLFLQERMGRNFRPFKICKFRTMMSNSEKDGAQVTVRGDSRITRVGRFLRGTKLDELPQLINIIIGEMSFVGPRPEVQKYVELFRSDYQKLLSVRPGITDPASLKFASEEALLSQSENWEKDYVDKVLPEKIAIASKYLEKQTLFSDIRIILATIFRN